MQLKYFILLFFFIPTITLAANQEEEIRQNLEMWQPKSVEIQNGTATIILKENQITDTIYEAMITAGLCMGTITRPKSLNGISQIKILNKFGLQGYIFQGGGSECSEIINMPGSKTKIYIFERTRMHTNQ